MREAPSEPNLKYPWQQALLDAFMEFHPKHIRDELTPAETAISGWLLQEPTDLDEVCALGDALLALRTLSRESKKRSGGGSSSLHFRRPDTRTSPRRGCESCRLENPAMLSEMKGDIR